MNKTPSHATMQRLFKGSIMVSTLVLLRATFRTYFDAHTLDSFNISIYVCQFFFSFNLWLSIYAHFILENIPLKNIGVYILEKLCYK